MTRKSDEEVLAELNQKMKDKKEAEEEEEESEAKDVPEIEPNKTQIVEREINLSLINDKLNFFNDKLNFIISKLQEK